MGGFLGDPREARLEPGSEFDGLADEESIWRLATALANALTPSEVAEAVAQEGGAAAGGYFANMAVLEQGSEAVRVAHHSAFDSGAGAQWSTFALEEHVPACEAIRTGEPVLLGSAEEIVAQYPHPSLVAEIETAGLSARASVPLRAADGAVLGAAGFGWQRPQTFPPAQRRRLELIAQLTGLALARANTYVSEQRLHTRLPRALETMPGAFFSLDRDLRVTYVNPEAEKALRTSREKLIGKHLLEAFPAANTNEFARQYDRVAETGRPAVFEEYYAPLKSWFEVHAWPDQDGLNISFSNINERRSAELKRTAALSQAEDANARLSFLTELSSQLSGLATRVEVFERLTRSVVPSMADWCTLNVPGRDELVRIAAAHRDSSLDSLAKRLVGSYPHAYSGPSPGIVVYRSGEPLRLSRLAQQIVDDLDDSIASAAYGRTLQLLGDGPGLIMPIRSRGEVVAVLTMVRAEGEPFSDAEVELMSEAAARVSIALDDAQHVESQRETANALHAAALPKALPVLAGLTLAAGYRAASEGLEVGGDWYDAFELQNGRVALVVGDTAGHGAQAAAVMAQMRNLLRAHLFSSLGPAESLNRLSRLIATQEPDAFATIICAEIDPATGEFIWATAGHPAPILVNSDGTSVHLRNKSALPPIGWMNPNPSQPEDENRLILSPATRVLMFTDGLIERRGVNLEIGLTHLMIVAEQTHGDTDPNQACEAILKSMLSDIHDDDVCLLIADHHR